MSLQKFIKTRLIRLRKLHPKGNKKIESRIKNRTNLGSSTSKKNTSLSKKKLGNGREESMNNSRESPSPDGWGPLPAPHSM